MMSSRPLSDAATRRRIGPWHPDRVPPLDDFEPDTNFLVRAAAGSGKTTALVARIVGLVRTGVPIDECTAITFTRKAAGEMKARVFRELRATLHHVQTASEPQPKEEERLSRALRELPGCFIGTIHSFCARILRDDPLAAGLPPDFTAGVDAREQEEQRQQVWHAYLAETWNASPERIQRIAALGIEPDELVHFFGQLCRYPDLTPYVDGPEHPPDLDATVETLRDAVDRWMPALPDDPADASAKPGTAAKTLRHAHRMLEIHPLDDPASKADFIGLFDGITKTDRRTSTETTVRGDLTKSHWQDEHLADELDNERLPALEREVVRPALREWRAYVHRHLVEFVQPAVARYTEHRRETGQLTFQDLLLCTRDLLREEPDVRRELQARYPRLLIDEFQDTDPLQAEILFFLASQDPREVDWRQCQPRDGSLFIVGDDKQSIYRFRRADLDVYNAVRHALASAPNGEDVTLDTNFRSTPGVLGWCNDAFGPLFDEINPPYQASYVPFEAARSGTNDRMSVHQLRVPYVKGSSSTREIARRNARQIAALVASACRTEGSESGAVPLAGESPGDFMVLTRNTARLDEFAEAFAEHGLPYTLAGGDDVNASTELHALVSLLTCIERRRDPVARLAYLRGPLVGLSDDALFRYKSAGGPFDGPFSLSSSVASALSPDLRETLETAYAHLQEARTLLDTLRPSAALERIVDQVGLMARTRRDPGMGSLHAGRLLRILIEIQHFDGEGLEWTTIRDELQQILDGERSLDGITLETGTDEAVQLLNVHKAKGLEAPVVFLADPYGGTHPKDPEEHVRRDQGTVVLPVYEDHRYHRTLRYAPDGWDPEYQQIEATYQRAEEHRLLYVAATRAEDQLIVSRYRSPSWSQDKGYWAPLYPYLDGVPSIDVPSNVLVPDPGPADPSPKTTEASLARVAEPSYRRQQVSDLAAPPSTDTDGYGRAFGTALHRLFEYVIQQRRHVDPSTGLSDSMVHGVLEQYDVDTSPEVASRILDTFLASDLWTKICRAKTVHTELPVAGLGDGPPPTLTDGTIDLLYESLDGWHLVDFKTVKVPDDQHEALVDHYRDQLQTYAELWTQATDEDVVERAVWFADAGLLRAVSEAGDAS